MRQQKKDVDIAKKNVSSDENFRIIILRYNFCHIGGISLKEKLWIAALAVYLAKGAKSSERRLLLTLRAHRASRQAGIEYMHAYN